MQTTCTCQLPAEDHNSQFILQTNWKEDYFEMVILDRGKSWTGNVSRNDVKKLSEQLQMSPEEYLRTTQGALTTQGGANNFSYAVADKHFIWKKQFEAPKNIKIKFGSVQLQPIPFVEATEQVIGSVLNTANGLMDKLTILEKEKDKRLKEKTLLMTQLLAYKKEMVETEELLYNKFLALINAKKEKIAELENELQSRLQGSSISQGNNAMDIDASKSDEDTLPVRRRQQKVSKTAKTSEKLVGQPNKGVKRKPCIPETEHGQSSSRNANDDKHYSSDTEVDDTDTEEEKEDKKSCSANFISSKDSLFSEIETDSEIPKIAKRGTKPLSVNKTQSSLKIQNSSSRNIKNEEEMEEFNTQALLDDF